MSFYECDYDELRMRISVDNVQWPPGLLISTRQMTVILVRLGGEDHIHSCPPIGQWLKSLASDWLGLMTLTPCDGRH